MTDPGPSVAVEESGKDFTIHEDDKDSAAEGAELEVKPVSCEPSSFTFFTSSRS